MNHQCYHRTLGTRSRDTTDLGSILSAVGFDEEDPTRRASLKWTGQRSAITQQQRFQDRRWPGQASQSPALIRTSFHFDMSHYLSRSLPKRRETPVNNPLSTTNFCRQEGVFFSFLSRPTIKRCHAYVSIYIYARPLQKKTTLRPSPRLINGQELS